MIPKIIHYVWLGGKPLPVEFQQYIEHWKELMPDWQFYCWNEDNFDITVSKYCREAYEAKKFAFASDYIRLKCVYEYGGIYLDTDEEVLQPLTPFLSLDAFFSLEPGPRMSGGVFGAEKHNDEFGAILDYYDSIHFLNSNGEYNLTVIGSQIYNVLRKKHPNFSINSDDKIELREGCVAYPSHYFCPDLATLKIDQYSYTIHHPKGSWLTPFGKIKLQIYKCIVNHKISRWVYERIKR